MERVDWSAKNQKWSLQWGNVIDSKSVKIVTVSREEKKEMETSQLCLPIALWSQEADLVRKEVQKELKFLNNLIKAVNEDKLDEFELQVEEDEKERVRVAENKKLKKKVDLKAFIQEKNQEKRFVETLDDGESCESETCKLCNSLKVVEGQVGLHLCKR